MLKILKKKTYEWLTHNHLVLQKEVARLNNVIIEKEEEVIRCKEGNSTLQAKYDVLATNFEEVKSKLEILADTQRKEHTFKTKKWLNAYPGETYGKEN